MGLSAVARQPMLAAMPSVASPAGAGRQATGLSAQDQVALIAARPVALHSAVLAAANLVSADVAGSASDQGSVDTYL
jgi:hypothetical protein